MAFTGKGWVARALPPTRKQAQRRPAGWWVLMAGGLLATGMAVAAPADTDILVNHDGLYGGAPEIGGLARGIFTYRAKVKLNAGSDAVGVQLQEVLPVGAVLQNIVSAPAGIACLPALPAGTVLTAANNTFVCDVGTLGAADGFKSVDFDVMLPTVNTNWKAVASASLDTGPIDADGGVNNIDLARNFTTYDAADLGISLTPSATAVNNGEAYSYTLRVTNHGPTDIPAAGHTRVTFEVPSGATITGAPAFPGGAGAWSCTPAAGAYPITSGIITCDHPGQLAGTPAAVLPDIVIPAEASMSGPIGAAASVQGFQNAMTPMPDGQKDNNTDSAVVTSSGSGYVDMSLSKIASKAFVDAKDGQATVVEYTLTPRRVAGAIVPQDILVTDNLPAGMTFAAFSAGLNPGWSCSSTVSTVTCRWAGPFSGNIATNMPAIKFTANVAGPGVAKAGTTLVNDATLVLESQAEPNITNNKSQAIVTLSNTAQLTLNKSKVGMDLPVLRGDPFSYTLAIGNTGPMDVLPGQAITVTETPGPRLLLTGVTAGWSCAPGFAGGATNAPQTCTNSDGLANGAETTLVFNAQVDDLGGAEFAQFTNNATAGAGPDRGGMTVNSSANVTVSENVADVGVVKSLVPPPALPVRSGDEVTYRITVTNHGTVVSKDIEIIDVLRDLVTRNDGIQSGGTSLYPAGGFMSATASGAGAAVVDCPQPSGNADFRERTLTCTVDQLVPGESVTVELKIRPKVDLGNLGAGGASYKNAVTAYSQAIHDANENNNQSEVDLKMTSLVDLTVDKQVAPLTEAAAGEPVKYSITTTNLGPSHAEGVAMVDQLPADAFLIGVPDAHGGSCTYKDGKGAAVTNPDGMRGGTISCTWPGALAAKGLYLVEYMARSAGDNPAPGTRLRNVVDVTTTTEEIRLDNNHAQAEIGLKRAELDVAIDMNHTKDGLVLGETTEYTLIIKNTGASYATQVKVTDAFPASIVDKGTTLNSSATFSYQGGLALAGIGGATPSWCTQPAVGATSGQLDCTIPLMAPGETLTIKFTMKAESLPGKAKTGTIFHKASVKPHEEEYLSSGADVLANNATTDRTSTSQAAHNVDLGVDKKGPSTVLDDGDTATYTLAVTNYGRDPQSPAGATVTDVLPVGLEFISASAGCSYASGTRTVTCSVPQLAKGGTAVFTLETKLDKPYKGARPLVNSATVTVPGDGNPDNDKSTTTTPLKPGPGSTASIPTLSQWGLMLMSCLLALMALGAMRRRERL